MKIRKIIKKWLYGRCPGFAGAFPYYGTKVYFPSNSLMFQLACEQGIYESENLRIISGFATPGSVYFDIGANIGLMSVPILRICSSCTVVSMEPSPNTLPFLLKTAQRSEFQDRWRIVGKAAGSSIGQLDFFTASKHLGAFDGFRDTNRAGITNKVVVPVTTVDTEWESMGKPPVSFMKVDVEGGEIQALKGAFNCIRSEKPYILLEWNAINLKAHNCEPGSLLSFVESNGYQILSLPYLSAVDNLKMLQIQMCVTESFLLAPN